MKLVDCSVGKFYKILNFGSLNKDEVLAFYEQGIIEGEEVQIDFSINVNKNIIIINVNDNIFAFSKNLAKEVEVEEINE